VQIRSAEIHYARVPRAYWKDRLQRLAAMGMNAIATYVPWNWHEETEGNFNFHDNHDVAAFIQTAQDVGLMVLLRAGPYICGEWEFGGFPAWLLTKNVTLRTNEPNYISQVDLYWAQLLTQVKPLLYSNGGPIVMFQVENEYGSYGNVAGRDSDKQYIEHLVDFANDHFGKGSVVLYTTDGGNTAHMNKGSLPGDSILTVGDGGWACDAQKEFNPEGLNACMNSETYTGWLTHWGEGIANRSASDLGTGKQVAQGRSFNLYMGHGGSNFGFWSGSNGGGKKFQPDITSYDYNSPVSENGDHGVGKGGGDKFQAFFNAMQPFAPPGGFPAEPAPIPRKAYGDVRLTARAELLKSLATLAPAGPKTMEAPTTMETLGQNYGLIYYEASVSNAGSTLEIEYPRDRAQVFVDGVYNGAIYRPEAAPLSLKTPAQAGSTLGLLVENMGRLNFGGGIFDPKGINTPVLLDSHDAASQWKAYSIPLDYESVAAMDFVSVKDCSQSQGPTFYKGVLHIDGTPEDTWLRPTSWTKGIMWVNGFNMGRYWTPQGPQQAFYMPAPYLKTGDNEVVILELESGDAHCTVNFDDKPDFSGKPTPSIPCDGVPQAGDVLYMHNCDGNLADHMAWIPRNDSSGASQIIALSGGLCLGKGPATDPQSGAPSATVVDCSEAVHFTMKGNQVADSSGDGLCLDITANGETPGEAVEWYNCNARNNQLWDFVETPAHTQQVVSKMDGKCLSACPLVKKAFEIAV